MKPYVIHIFLLFLLFSPANLFADVSLDAEELYRQAKVPGISTEERVRFLQMSVDKARSYQALFALGRTYNDLGESRKAVAAFEQAAATTTDREQHAKALGVSGRIQAAMGNDVEAGIVIKRSLKEKYDPALAKELMALEKKRGAVVSATEIGNTLSKGISMRSIGVAVSVDLRVGFDFNSAQLDAKGKEQVDEIARALADPQFAGMKMKLVGHTDRRGDDSYNDNLSRKRAEAVRRYLATTNKNFVEMVFLIEGKGKREPLFYEDTDDANAMNRRVELVLE